VIHDDRNGEWPDLDALWRMATGRSDPSDAERLQEWLRMTPNAGHVEQGLRAIEEQADALAASYDVEAAVARLRSDMGIGRALPVHQPARRPSVTRWARRVLAVAAVAAVCVWGVDRLTPYGRVMRAAWQVVESTSVGEVRRLRLPDNTDVVLGPETTIRYRVDRSRGRRDVWLDGEARFAVAAAPGRRFRVYAAHSTAEDIGTTFTVRAYRTDSMVRVVVLEGAVVLRARSATRSSHARTLIAGELGQRSRDGDVRGERVDPELYMAWTRDTLAFQDTPLLDVARQLKRWYGVDVTVDSTLVGRTLTGSFAYGALPTTLAAIAAAIDARHDLGSGRVRFTPR
jgi:ferric-dicitrate binding protein FerR (iron transport regulator)